MKLSTALGKEYFELYGDKIYENIKSIGFDCIDYNMPFYDGDKPNPEIYNTNMTDFEKYFLDEKKKIEQAGLYVGQTHSPYHVYNKDRELFDCRIEEIKYSIIATAVMGCEYTVVHPAQPCWFDPDKDPQFTRSVNKYLFEKLIPVAKEYGVKLALENMPGAGVPTASPQCLIEYIDMMKSDSMVACLDTGHANLAGENICSFAQQLGDRLCVLHLHDNCGRMDEHYVPFLGLIGCWKEFISTLHKINYNGTLNLECGTFVARMPIALRDDAIKMSYKTLVSLTELSED